MRIGEILVEHRWLQPAVLERALADQRASGKRLCSFLIARGLLDADNAARALAEQHGVSGVLQRHLVGRDASLAGLIPAEVAHRRIALPIGRTRNLDLIVCLRDPTDDARAELAAVVAGSILIAVAPASQLEDLVAATYPLPAAPAPAADSYEVDLSTRPIDVRGLAAAAISEPPVTVPELGTLTLVGLDDDRVAKDPTQVALPRTNTGTSGLFPGAPGPVTRPKTPSTPTPRPGAPTLIDRRASGATALGTAMPRTTTGPAIPRTSSGLAAGLPPTIEATMAALDKSATRDDATAVAMKFVAGRWTHAVLLAIRDGNAVGYRGHGPEATDEALRALSIPLSAPTMIKLACDARRIVSAPGDASTLGEVLAKLLAEPRECTAAPITIGRQIACILAVGEGTKGNPVDATADLDLLADALTRAYERQLRTTKP